MGLHTGTRNTAGRRLLEGLIDLEASLPIDPFLVDERENPGE